MTSTPTPANDPSARRRWIFVLAAGVIVGGGVALAVALSQGGSGSAPPPEGAGGADVVPLVEPQETFSIRVRWPGATAEEVDALVATPMAASLGGFEDIDDLEIVSRDGEAVAIATLARTVRSPEVAKIREGAARRVATRLPAEAEIIAFRGDLTAPPDHLVVLTSDALPPSALGLLAGGPVRARVEVLAGVTDVAALGVPAQEVLVSLDPARLNGLGLDVGAVVTAVRRPREVPGGAREGVDRGGLADLRAVVVGAGADGAPIRLSDVATISVGPTPGSGALRLDGRAVAGLAVHGDEKLTTDAIAAAVAPELPPSVALGWRAGTATAGHPAGLHVSLRLPAGSTEEGVVGALEQVEAAAARVPGKRSVLDWTQGPGAATLLVRGDWADRAAVEGAVEALRAALAEIPGILVRVAPLDARGFSPEPAPLVVTLSGEGAAALGQAADAVAEAIGGVVGVRSVWSSQADRAQQTAQIDRARAAELGVPVGAVQQTMNLAEIGLVVAELRDGATTLPVRVVVPGEARGGLTVAGADGARVPLASLVKTTVKQGPDRLERRKRSLSVTLAVDVGGRPLAEVRAEVERRLRDVALPAGVTARVAGAPR
ncbi:MAG: hypothetical protein CVU56_11120 [Deltaproteobacteria bacterium HGW-Deltaproteobacteria-14]|nr:MAG: hypothetical protein CVU56_11120 [Deltaproteobacteria bacterium HGW-Deltaproteobacteria-14]